MAGASPKSSPVRRETPRVKSRTRRSKVISCTRGNCCGLAATSRRTSPHARVSPSVPPTSESSMLSVRSWRTMRRRPAPSAVRMAISRRRATARASRRLATLAQAISRTRPTTASSTTRVWRTGPAESSRSGIKCTLWPVVTGYCWCRRAAGLEAADDVEIVGFAVGADISLPLGKGAEDFGNDVDGIDPELNVRSAVPEVGREDADDLHGLVVESERAANDGAVAGKVALPEAVGEQCPAR